MRMRAAVFAFAARLEGLKTRGVQSPGEATREPPVDE